MFHLARRDARAAEGARLEIACAGTTGTVGSNPTLSAHMDEGRRRSGPGEMRTRQVDRSLETCAFCPKLCSHACPVSSATRRETLTPWGKQTTLYEMLRGMVPTSKEYVEPLFACAECLGCHEPCDHGIDVPGSLRRGRATVFEHGLLPDPLRKLLRDQPRMQQQARDRVTRLPGARRPASGTRVILYPGCQPSIEDPGLVQDAMKVLDRLAGGSSAIFMDGCCGLPYLHVGDVEGFRAAARSLASQMAGLREVVVLDPACAHTILSLYPQHGIQIETQVTTLVQFVLPHLHRFVRRANPRGPVFYHDPCHLGRGLGIYDPPREILLRLVAGGARDLHTSREKEPCCGGGGALPVSMPDVAAQVANSLAGKFEAQGARTVITACPTCKRMLSGHHGLDVVDIVTLMAAAL